jgi:hypothetical protein
LTEHEKTEEAHKIVEEPYKTEDEGYKTEYAHIHKDDTDTICGPHLSVPEQLKTMPKFPEGTKSLLSKFLTNDIWEKL